MAKHILDRAHTDTGARTGHYAEIERQTGPAGSNDAAKTLHRRPKTRDSGRVDRFLRIERGNRA